MAQVCALAEGTQSGGAKNPSAREFVDNIPECRGHFPEVNPRESGRKFPQFEVVAHSALLPFFAVESETLVSYTSL